MSNRQALTLGALLAAVGVALGAFGAHGLEKRLAELGYEADLPQRLAWFDTGVRYQLYHALGLVVAASRQRVRWVGTLFLLGILLFSGSLYAMTFLPAEWKKLGAIVPLGGLSFIVGWVVLAYENWRADSSRNERET